MLLPTCHSNPLLLFVSKKHREKKKLDILMALLSQVWKNVATFAYALSPTRLELALSFPVPWGSAREVPSAVIYTLT